MLSEGTRDIYGLGRRAAVFIIGLFWAAVIYSPSLLLVYKHKGKMQYVFRNALHCFQRFPNVKRVYSLLIHITV